MKNSPYFQKMPFRLHKELAKASHPGHTNEAAKAFVARVLDMEVERRTLYGMDHLQGYHETCSTESVGVDKGGLPVEPLADVYARGIADHKDHKEARRIIESSGLTFRQHLAVLIQTAKTDRRVGGPRGMNYQQVVAAPQAWCRYLGWPPGKGKDLFPNTQALKDAAKSAKAKIIKNVRGTQP